MHWTDAETKHLDAVLAARRKHMETGRLVLAQSALVPARFAQDVNDALGEMAHQHDIEPAVHGLLSRYPLLR